MIVINSAPGLEADIIAVEGNKHLKTARPHNSGSVRPSNSSFEHQIPPFNIRRLTKVETQDKIAHRRQTLSPFGNQVCSNLVLGLYPDFFGP
jgi:hypothetical protein